MKLYLTVCDTWWCYARPTAIFPDAEHCKFSGYSHTHTHTHALPFYGPLSGITWVGRYQKRLVPEDITVDFKRRGEDNRGKCADNPAGRQLIRTIDAPTSITTYNQITIYTSKSFMHMSQ